MSTSLEANYVHVLTMHRKLFHPPVKEPQNWVFTIDDLGDNQEFHIVVSIVSDILIFGIPLHTTAQSFLPLPQWWCAVGSPVVGRL